MVIGLSMTHFLKDILRQPEELRRALDYLSGPGRGALEEAAGLVRDARRVYLTGIGSSFNAALCAHPLFELAPGPVLLEDAAELCQLAAIPKDAVFIVLSRSGRSVEIVNLVEKAQASGATVIALTNAKDGTLSRRAQIPLVVPVELDYAISVNTYSSLAAAAGALAATALEAFDSSLLARLDEAIRNVGAILPKWQEQISRSGWLSPGETYYFLARRGSLGSCFEARLVWEEGAKRPATAMGTGSFRHGPQEMVHPGARFAVWIDRERMREQDLTVARDLERLRASVMLIGQDLSEDAASLVLELPGVPADWQFLIDVIPAQLAAEQLARLEGADCDSFRYSSYIVENEYGLMPGEVQPPKNVAIDTRS
ncbi:MAG: SIS domain-containing protein [Acidobacteria bacterium]|nr:SIS domain-containing protein [Acidobacteriota bacterium]